MTMFSKAKMIVTAALILGSGTVALANDREGEESGFVLSGSTDGVNPAYHPDSFPGHAAQQGKARVVIDHAAPTTKAREAFGSAEPHAQIVRPLPAPVKEDNYGSAAGKE
jgi:hypothetical protein